MLQRPRNVPIGFDYIPFTGYWIELSEHSIDLPKPIAAKRVHVFSKAELHRTEIIPGKIGGVDPFPAQAFSLVTVNPSRSLGKNKKSGRSFYNPKTRNIESNR